MESAKKKKIVKISIISIVSILLIVGIIFVFISCNDIVDKKSKDFSNYYLNLTYDNNFKKLSGNERLEYKNNGENVLDYILLHLYPNAFRSDATYKPVSLSYNQKAYPNGFSNGEISILSVVVDGVEKEVNITGNDKNMLKVDFNESLFPNDIINIDISFEVVLPNCLHRFGYGDNTYNFGNFYPIASIYEDGEFRQDNYGSNGDPFYSEMANYYVELTYNKNFVLASSGKQLNTLTNGENKTTTIEAKSVRDFAFVLSEKFNVLTKNAGNTKVYYYYYDDENASKSLQAGVDAINTFSSLFGEYPYETFSICKTNFIHGGMEYPNLVYISDSVEDYDDYLNVIIHETAHQWWYNLVGSDACKNAWMDEGLTEFSTLLFYRHNGKNYNVNVQESLNSSLSSYLLFSEIYESVYGEFNSSMNRNVNDYKGDLEYVYIAYVKGVLFFDNLEDVVGEKNFLKGLKYYFKENQFGIAKPEDMIAAFEVSSKRSLESFFNSWIEGKVILQNY